MVMNPSEFAVELPEGITVGILEPVVSIQLTDSGIPANNKTNSVSERTLNFSDEPDDSYVGEEESGYDGSSEASVDSLDDDTFPFALESDLTGLHTKAATLSPSSNHPSSLTQCSHVSYRASNGLAGLSNENDVVETIQTDEKLIAQQTVP